MYITGTEVVRWLESLPPDAVVYTPGDPSTCCVVTTYAKTLDSRVESTAPNYSWEKGEAYGHVYQYRRDSKYEAIGTTTRRVAKMMDLFDSKHESHRNMTAAEALEILRKERI